MGRLVRIDHGEVGRTGVPGNMGPPVCPHANPVPIFVVDPSQVGGIDQRRTA